MAEKKTALIVVRTYPGPAKNGVEVSCTAAITDKGEWLRLFPVPYRRLRPEQQFSKYQWIEVEVERANDPRPESHKIIFSDSIRIIGEVSSEHEWQARKDIIFALKSESMCAIQRRRNDYGSPTLGIFKPKIKRLIIEPLDSPSWSQDELAILGQRDLFDDDPPSELEKIPYDFRYEYHCDDPECTGHSMKCTDWEMCQSWRSWRTKYGAKWEAPFRLKYEQEVMQKLDTYFYVGTLHKHPGAWIIVGLFYPPKSKLPLFPDET